MKQRTRIYYTENQKFLMSERWKQGYSVHDITALFNQQEHNDHAC